MCQLTYVCDGQAEKDKAMSHDRIREATKQKNMDANYDDERDDAKIYKYVTNCRLLPFSFCSLCGTPNAHLAV
jgi:hypothetical protein